MPSGEGSRLVWLSSDDSDDQQDSDGLNRRRQNATLRGGKRQKIGRLQSLNDKLDTGKIFGGTESPINRIGFNESINSNQGSNESSVPSPPLFVSETPTTNKNLDWYNNRTDLTNETLNEHNIQITNARSKPLNHANFDSKALAQSKKLNNSNLDTKEAKGQSNLLNNSNFYTKEPKSQSNLSHNFGSNSVSSRLKNTNLSTDSIDLYNANLRSNESLILSSNESMTRSSYSDYKPIDYEQLLNRLNHTRPIVIPSNNVSKQDLSTISHPQESNNTLNQTNLSNRDDKVLNQNIVVIDDNKNKIGQSLESINNPRLQNPDESHKVQASNAFPRDSIKSLNSKVEIISIDSDSDDEIVEEDVTAREQVSDLQNEMNDQNVQNYYANGNEFQNDQLARTSKNIGFLLNEEAQDGDDEIVVLDANDVANKKFKPSSFDLLGSRPQIENPLGDQHMHQNSQNSGSYNFPYYNQPAPITHVSDLDEDGRKSVIIQQLRQKELASLQEHEEMKRLLVTANDTQASLQNTAQTIKNSILSGMETMRRFLQQGAGHAAVSKVEEAIQKSKGELLNTMNKINHVQNQSNAFRKRVDMLSLSLRQINSLISHYLGHLNLSSFQNRNNIESNNIGYRQNIYNDNQDLQNLLDNIKSDEDLEEGLEFTPKEMSINLMKHQRMGLTWLKRMEESKSNGGILADDMGLGKTIQTIALIVANPPKEDHRKTTLIIAPVSLLRQWAAEVESKLKPEFALRIGIFHGVAKRDLNTAKKMLDYDIILTSYGTLSSEWKKHFLEVLAQSQEDKVPNFIPKAGTGGRSYTSPFFSQDSRFLRIILDEAQNIKNKLAIASRAVASLESTYRFCLSGTPMQNNIDELFPIIRFLRIRPYNSFEKFRSDISIPLKDNNQYDSRDREASMRKVRAILKAILLRRTKSTLIDGKPLLTLPEKHVISDYVKMEKEELQFYASLEDQTKRQAEKLLDSKSKSKASNILILLLRLRQACIHKYLVEIGEMKGEQNDSNVHSYKPKDFNKLYENIKYLDSSIILNIRQISGNKDSEKELLYLGSSAEIDIPKRENKDTDNMFTCPLCLELFSTDDSLFIFSKCGHMICQNCVDTFFDTCEVDEDSTGIIAECKDCKTRIRPSDLINYRLFQRIHDEGYNLEDFLALCRRYYGNVRRDDNAKLIKQFITRDNGFSSSVKIEKSIELIKLIFNTNPGEKIIIFSQFTTLFDLMKLVLDQEQIQYLRYDGSMSVEEKNSTIKAFYQSDCKILLISLRAGNVGLTLTCASHVIIMDPFWNPYVEEQAQDRAHRIGQAREVFVHRILIEGTIESRIMELQQQKKDLVGAALDENGMKSVSKLGRKELGFLFGLNALN